MVGGIYSRQRCPICGHLLNHKIKDGLVCPNHQHIRATRFFIKFKKTYKNFKHFNEAERYLTGLQFKTDEGTYDPRDYRRDNPLGFTNMSNKFLASLKPKTAENCKAHIDHAQVIFFNRNVKEILYGDFEDFINSLIVKDKTKNNIISTIKQFYKWMFKRQDIKSMPEFPEIKYVLGYRNTVSADVQDRVLEEIKRIAPLKVYLGVKWLKTYFAVRPAEMTNLLEGNIDIANAYFYFPTPKERQYKSVPILQEDVEILKQFPLSVPAMRFFRHEGGIKGTVKDQPYGEKYLYKWAKRAMDNMGVHGVDLYALTRHSTVRAKRPHYSPEQLKRAAMSRTNKAFDRYLGADDDEQIREIYSSNVVAFEKKEVK